MSPLKKLIAGQKLGIKRSEYAAIWVSTINLPDLTFHQAIEFSG